MSIKLMKNKSMTYISKELKLRIENQILNLSRSSILYSLLLTQPFIE